MAQVKTWELVVKLSKENPSSSQKTIANKARISQKSVSNILKKFEENLGLDRKVGSGRKSGYADSGKAKKVVALLEKNPNLSERKLARKVDCSKALVGKIKSKEGLKTYKVQKIPDRNATKNLDAKNRAKKLREDFFQNFRCCIMDDETYVLSKFSQLPGQGFYVAKERGGVEEQFRVQHKSKFPKRFMVWQAICSCGLRSASFVTQGMINGEIYVKECLQKRLRPLILKHEVSTFFWPDLASCHYSKTAMEWFRSNGVTLVPKEANPPNCPELRPIEKYWALVKRNLKETKGEANNIKSFKNKWRYSEKKVTKDTIKALMGSINEKINDFSANK